VSHISVGFIGVGAIASAIATAILDRPQPPDVEVLLSPRSSERSEALAARFAQARVMPDNQAVVDGSDIVMVAVLPDQVAETCSALRFRPDQVVVGIAAGWPPARLRPLVAPAETLGQLIPLPMIALGVGPVVLYPSIPAVESLLAGCGTLVVLEREEQVGVLSAGSAIMSSFFAFQNAAIDWVVDHGFDRSIATGYITSQLHGLASESIAMDPAELAGAVAEHETPGGLNEQVRMALTDRGMFAELADQLELLYRDRVRS
jgi:pyrroline-5-carboxylate reductase